MPEDYTAVVISPLGKLGVRTLGEALCGVDILPSTSKQLRPRDPFAASVISQLFCYFKNPLWHIEVPIDLQGTAFQKRVWNALRTIPPGQVTSYGALARRLRTGARAVAGACRTNPILLIVPCHRVVATVGIGGFMGKRSGEALRIKRWLLQHEQRAASGDVSW